MIASLQLRSGGEHSDLGLAVQARQGPGEGGRRRRWPADIKSNNPQLTGGE